MYQIPATCGYEIQVIVNLCRVENHENRTVFAGTYEECVAWLAARGVKVRW